MPEWISLNVPLGMLSASLSVAMLLAIATAPLPGENRDSPSSSQAKMHRLVRERSPWVQRRQSGRLKPAPCRETSAGLTSVNPLHGGKRKMQEDQDFVSALEGVKNQISGVDSEEKTPLCMCGFLRNRCRDCSVSRWRERNKKRRKSRMFFHLHGRVRNVTHRERSRTPKSVPIGYFSRKKHKPQRSTSSDNFREYGHVLDRLEHLGTALSRRETAGQNESKRLMHSSRTKYFHRGHQLVKANVEKNLPSGRVKRGHNSGRHSKLSKRAPLFPYRVPLKGTGNATNIWERECGACRKDNGTRAIYKDSCFNNVTYCPWCNCRNKGSCRVKTAACLAGCAYGWSSPSCWSSLCPEQSFAPYEKCEMACASKCEPQEVCHPVTGECYPLGNYSSQSRCPRKTHGTYCNLTCNCHSDRLCNPATGVCPEGLCVMKRGVCEYSLEPVFIQSEVLSIILAMVIFICLKAFTLIHHMLID